MKADWNLATSYLGFTPHNDSDSARQRLLGTIGRQLGNGLVVEIVPKTLEKPRDGSPHTAEELSQQKQLGGRLVAVHQILPRGFHVREVMPIEEYEETQRRWADPQKPWRWSLGIPVLRSWDIVEKPMAAGVFGQSRYLHHMGHAAGALRPLDDDDRVKLSPLKIRERARPTCQAAVLTLLREWEETHRKLSDPTPSETRADRRDIQDDDFAEEGETKEQRAERVRRSTALVAHVKQTRPLACCACSYDAVARAAELGLIGKAKSLIHAHHRYWPLRGARVTKADDLMLLCPNCHSEVHAGRALLAP